MSAPGAATEIVVCTGFVAAPLERVWELVSDFGGVARWSIGPVSCTVEGSGVGAIRTIRRGDGVVRERLERWDATDHSFSYSFVDDIPLPVDDLVGTIAVRRARASAAAETEIVWSARGVVAAGDVPAVRDVLGPFFTHRIGELQAIVLGASATG